MDRLISWIARAFIRGIQALPLRLVARLGQAGGFVFFLLDARHRRVALKNLARCFEPELSPTKIRRLACENFARIGESYLCAIKTASLDADGILKVLTVAGLEKIGRRPGESGPVNRVFVIGHFGNFELLARAGIVVPGTQAATTYRALRPAALDRVLQDLRAQSGCLFFERRRDGAELRKRMAQGGMMVGLLADQHAGRRGIGAPFFGVECSTSPAPAVLALRYHCPLHAAICYRVGLGRWRVEVGDEIPTRMAGRPRSVTEICYDMNRELETAVRRDPANWFWVHQRWKTVGRKAPAPAANPTR
jgi:KDO2-lipid IV(A) lauroyltransferase